MSEIFDIGVLIPQSPPCLLGWSQQHVDGAVVIQLAGELDMATTAELDLRLSRVVESDSAAAIVLWPFRSLSRWPWCPASTPRSNARPRAGPP